MKMLVLVLALMFAGVAHAGDSEFGITAGFRTNNMDVDGNGNSVTGQNGFQIGGLAWFHFADPLSLRLGFVYSQRYAQIKSTSPSTTTDVKLTYLDIPLTLQYKFGDFGGVFAGPVFAMNQ